MLFADTKQRCRLGAEALSAGAQNAGKLEASGKLEAVELDAMLEHVMLEQ